MAGCMMGEMDARMDGPWNSWMLDWMDADVCMCIHDICQSRQVLDVLHQVLLQSGEPRRAFEGYRAFGQSFAAGGLPAWLLTP